MNRDEYGPSKQDVNTMCRIAMDSDKLELVKLRVSVARIAQVVGVSLAPVGLPAGMPYEVLARTAATRDRGWNLLCAHIVDMVERDFSAKFEK